MTPIECPDMDAGSDWLKRKRRPHTKSRSGNCKRRKVKCDEAKPSCQNCLKFSLPCDFDPYTTTQNASESATLPYRKKTLRGRPRKDWGALCASTSLKYSNTPSTGQAITLSEPPIPNALTGAPCTLPLNIDDLELMHNYTTRTAPTLGDVVLWRDQIPILGLRHNCLLRIILAISAQHCARLRPQDSHRYEQLAEEHYSDALHQVTGLLPRLDHDNCSALYFTIVSICLSTFARKQSPDNLIVIAEAGGVSWWYLMRGVRYVIDTMGWPAIFSNGLSHEPSAESASTPSPSTATRKRLRWRKALADISNLVTLSGKEDAEVYQRALNGLEQSFLDTFGDDDSLDQPREALFQNVMAWLYRLEDDFVCRLEEKQSLALIILAHFAVLIRPLESFWYMEGWAEHILHGVARMLRPVHLKWLAWPSDVLGDSADECDGLITSVEPM
ncbi:hypothetical protein AAE478_008928 [Parahypoxylon ruwenzoriense]